MKLRVGLLVVLVFLIGYMGMNAWLNYANLLEIRAFQESVPVELIEFTIHDRENGWISHHYVARDNYNKFWVDGFAPVKAEYTPDHRVFFMKDKGYIHLFFPNDITERWDYDSLYDGCFPVGAIRFYDPGIFNAGK